MHLEKLELLNFKNYQEVSLEFPSKVNCFLGLNGSGKTNLLDAIYYLSFTKSFLNAADSQHIRYGCDSFVVRGRFEEDGKKHELACQVRQGQKKVFLWNGNEVKPSDHIGNFPVVLISPSDIDLIKEGSEERRKFFDSMISQIDHAYLLTLVEYNHCLKQRNGLLRMFQERNQVDTDLLDSYDQRLVRTGCILHQTRTHFMTEFLPFLTQSYYTLTNHKEEVRLSYQSQLSDSDFLIGLRQSLSKDLALQRTTFGVHRDDYGFDFAHGELKRLGSQGQQKSFLVALKLANFEVIKKHKGLNPILLLDDIFDKLDDHRIHRLLQIVTDKKYGQLFITDAGPERTQHLLTSMGIQAGIFNVQEGTISKA